MRFGADRRRRSRSRMTPRMSSGLALGVAPLLAPLADAAVEDGHRPVIEQVASDGHLVAAVMVQARLGSHRFQVNLKLGLTPHACIQSSGHSQDGPSNHAPTRSVCTAAAVASLRARFSHSCGINVSLASLGRCARTCERYHGLFSPGSRPTGSSQTLSASPTGLRARWACGLMVLGTTKC